MPRLTDLLLVMAVAAPIATRAHNAGDAWTREPDLPIARSAHAVVSTHAAIFVAGGTGPDGRPVLSLHRFDGAIWTDDSVIPGEGLNGPAAAVLGDHLYLIGGFGTTSNRPVSAVHKYDLRRRTWTDAAPLPAPRGGHAAVALNGRIHVIGGGNSQSTIDDHSVYDPRTNRWTEKARLPRRLGSPAAVALDGKMYSVGGRSGFTDFGDVHVYEPARDTWTAGPAIEPRGTGGAAVLGGRIFYIGGESQSEQRVLDAVLRLDRSARQWTTATRLPTPRNYARAVVFHDAIYVVGGSTQFGSSHASRGSAIVERFNPRPAGSW